MALRIVDDTMTLEIDNRIVATAGSASTRGRRQRRVDRLDLSCPAVHPRPAHQAHHGTGLAVAGLAGTVARARMQELRDFPDASARGARPD